MFQNGQKVVVVSSGDPARVIKVQAASSLDTGRYPTVDTTGVTGRDQQVQIVSGGDETRFPKLQGLADARSTADSVISALSPAAWYRNATGVTSAGGFASQWDDYSGNANHLVQGTGIQQPAYSAGVLTFDGTNDRMETGAIAALDQPTTIIYLLKQVSWSSGEYLADGAADNVGALRQTTSSPKISIYAGSTACEQNGPAIGSFGVVVCVFNGASSYTRVDNGAKVTGNPGAGTMLGVTLGGPGASGINYGHVAYKEVAAWGSALADADVDAVVTALLAI